MDNCIHNIKKVNSNVNKYIQDPNEKNIHKVRTSIRRLETSFISSPKQIRNKEKIKEQISKAKEFFSANSEIRDIDVILEKIQKEGKITREQFVLFEKTLKDSKKEKLDNTHSLALELENNKISKLYNKKSYHSKKMNNKIVKRISKVIGKYIGQINSMIPTVIADGSKIDELHKLRKDSKKLRYIFELLIEKESLEKGTGEIKINSKSNNKTEFILQCIEKLEEIQNIIGQIRDYDITLEYLRHQAKDPNILKLIIKNITLSRNKKYIDFVNYCQLDLLESSSILFKIENLAID